jgi:hypothetical protein
MDSTCPKPSPACPTSYCESPSPTPVSNTPPKEIEAAFDDSAEPGMWAGKHFTAPLATSCNISGDPLGSIVDEQRALEFANSRGVGLFVTGEAAKGEYGSYPILELAHEGVSVRRAERPPGLVNFKVTGRDLSLTLDSLSLPLAMEIRIDSEAAASGHCATADFAVAGGGCVLKTNQAKCR